jgi:hypothetical protein
MARRRKHTDSTFPSGPAEPPSGEPPPRFPPTLKEWERLHPEWKRQGLVKQPAPLKPQSDKPPAPSWTLFPPLPPAWRGPSSRTAEDMERHRRELEMWERQRDLAETLGKIAQQTTAKENVPEQASSTKPLKELLTLRPKGLGPRVWLAVQEIDKLRETGKWIDTDDLLAQVRDRLGGPEWASKRTLERAVAWLRKMDRI